MKTFFKLSQDDIKQLTYCVNSSPKMKNKESNNPTVVSVSYVNDFEYKINSDKTLTITKYIGHDSVLTIPNMIDGRRVSSVGDGAFEKNEFITKIIISEGIESIDCFCFSQCERLNEVVFPASIYKIGMCAFMKCGKIEKITLPNNMDIVSKFCFLGCKGLTEINISEKIRIIYPGAFQNCLFLGLRGLNLPDNITLIDEKAFYNCWIHKIEVGDIAERSTLTFTPNSRLEFIGKGAFSGGFEDIEGIFFLKV